MKTFLLLTISAVITTSGLLACTAITTDTIPPVSAAGLIPGQRTMKAFGSEEEMARYFRELAEKQKQFTNRALKSEATSNAAAPMATDTESEAKAKNDESVTNVQHAGVDEGGIVKVHGDHLVVLRRGRLFTVAIGDGALKPISNINAFGPDIDPQDTWYDEMLVADN